MPVISTCIAASMWKASTKNTIEAEENHYCSRSFHQGSGQFASHAAREDRPVSDFSSVRVTTQKITNTLPSYDVPRAPFRSFNGRAYAFPLSVVKRYGDALQCVSNEATPEEKNRYHAALKLPGVLWRHDPYSAKVLAATPITPGHKTSFAGGGGSSMCGIMFEENAGERWEAVDATVESGIPFGTYNSDAWNSMCMLNPTSAPLGTVLYFPTESGAYSFGAYSAFPQQYYNTMPQAQQHFTESCTTTTTTTTTTTMMSEAVEYRSGGGLEHCQCAAAGSITPSARPLPSASGRFLFVRSPSSLPLPAPASDVSNTPRSKDAAVVIAGYLGESERRGSQGHEIPFEARRSRSFRAGNTRRDYGDKFGECPSTLPMFFLLPTLFTDLTAYTKRRPPRAGKKNDSDSQLRVEDVHYVYLVGHRCRRTVCAASVLHEVGEMVVLEGDMGIEMGSVQLVLPVEEFEQMETAELARRGFPTEHDVVTAALILRNATEEETQHYNHTLRQLSKDLLKFLKYGLNPARFFSCEVQHMFFLDCEFQADCKKIYIYYRARTRVLFRELAQYLYCFYRCRIWLHEVGKCEFKASGDFSQDAEIS
ncbi:hypothetical protein ECC02_007326 [Trypanosoma cruzi]|uniref:PSP1 C-terminal domain-containing protein n=1 Tax=Trypanosoma cruzi TaxID=5693 RepID=A0A7J6Y0N8_TRYCR|nr:hypothetical protein ECC02_007326 [Trypanosoma cruzi]